MHFLYILFSNSLNKFYIGQTTNVEIRTSLHNLHHFKNAFTNAAKDWKVVLSFECADKSQAMFLEKFIKRMKSRKFIEKIINDPEILTNLLSKKSD